jgi:hypothetical protein
LVLAVLEAAATMMGNKVATVYLHLSLQLAAVVAWDRVAHQLHKKMVALAAVATAIMVLVEQELQIKVLMVEMALKSVLSVVVLAVVVLLALALTHQVAEQSRVLVALRWPHLLPARQ